METVKVTLFFFLCGILQCIKAACFSSSSAVAPPALFRFGHARYTGLRLEAIVDLWFRLRRSAPEQRDSVGKRSAKIWIVVLCSFFQALHTALGIFRELKNVDFAENFPKILKID